MTKMLGPILYQILCMFLNDSYAKYMFIRFCSSFPCQLSEISMKKLCTNYKTNGIKGYRVISLHVKTHP